MKKKVLLLAILTLVAAAALAGCGKKDADQLEAIKKNGKVVVAMEGAWAPWTYHDDNDKLVGFDTEVAALIAKKLGVEVEYAEGDWDGLFLGLESGRYNMIVNGVEVTEKRKETYDFTEPYAYIKTALIVRGDNEEIKSFEDLKGKTTANSLNSTYMVLGEQYGATCKSVDTLEETIEMVLSGRVDATLNADVSIADYLALYPDANIKIVAYTDEATPVAIPLRRGGNEAYLEAVNKAIKELHESGELAEISKKYFGGMDITTSK